MESRLEVIGRENAELLLNGYRVFVWRDGKVLQIVVNIMLLNYTFNNS